MATHNESGKIGEELALAYLRKEGYKIIACNWYYKHKEIDIIAYDKEKLVIVEVKLRTTDTIDNPDEIVTPKKQKFLVEAAEAYLQTIKEAPEVRFDVIFVIQTHSGYKLEHIDDAFNP